MSDVTKARDMLAETQRLAPALRFIAQNPEKQLSFVCGKFQVSPTDMWAWLAQFNGGKKDVSETRINGVLTKAGLKPDDTELAAAAAEASEAGVPQASVPKARKGDENSARNVDEPWLKLGTTPRSNAISNHRATIFGISRGKDPEQTHGWYQFSTKWFGTHKPSPAQAESFLGWLDTDRAAAAVKTVTEPKKERVARTVATKKGKRSYSRRTPLPAKISKAHANSVQPPPIPAMAPPTGLRPRWLVEEERMFEIAAAAKRYHDAGMTVPMEWVGELLPLICNFNQRRTAGREVPSE